MAVEVEEVIEEEVISDEVEEVIEVEVEEMVIEEEEVVIEDVVEEAVIEEEVVEVEGIHISARVLLSRVTHQRLSIPSQHQLRLTAEAGPRILITNTAIRHQTHPGARVVTKMGVTIPRVTINRLTITRAIITIIVHLLTIHHRIVRRDTIQALMAIPKPHNMTILRTLVIMGIPGIKMYRKTIIHIMLK